MYIVVDTHTNDFIVVARNISERHIAQKFADCYKHFEVREMHSLAHGWIPVEEEMPNLSHGWVLVTQRRKRPEPGYAPQVHRMYYDENRGQWRYGLHALEDYMEVTHWRPLPKPAERERRKSGQLALWV